MLVTRSSPEDNGTELLLKAVESATCLLAQPSQFMGSQLSTDNPQIKRWLTLRSLSVRRSLKG